MATSRKKIRPNVDYVVAVLFVNNCFAQLLVVPLANQKQLLQSNDPKLAANKKLVYDCWRELLEAGHLELANKYLAEDYMQHNPSVPTGRKGFVDFFSKFAKPQPVVDTIKANVVAIVAEANLVMICFASYIARNVMGIKCKVPVRRFVSESKF